MVCKMQRTGKALARLCSTCSQVLSAISELFWISRVMVGMESRKGYGSFIECLEANTNTRAYQVQIGDWCRTLSYCYVSFIFYLSLSLLIISWISSRLLLSYPEFSIATNSAESRRERKQMSAISLIISRVRPEIDLGTISNKLSVNASYSFVIG